jgi:hypothetical protein
MEASPVEIAIIAHPEMVAGLVAGLIVAWRGRRPAPVLVLGMAPAALLVAGDASFTNACDGHGECTPPTSFDWTLVALANAGARAFGIAAGAATIRAQRGLA